MPVQTARRFGALTLVMLIIVALVSQVVFVSPAAAEGDPPDPPYGDPIYPDSTDGSSEPVAPDDSDSSLLDIITDFFDNLI